MEAEPEMSDAMESCPDCGRTVSREAASCPKCGHFFGFGRRVRKRNKTGPKIGGISWAWFAIIFILAMLFIRGIAAYFEETEYQERKIKLAQMQQPKIIDYRLLWSKQSQTHGRDGNYYPSLEMIILISEEATKAEVLQLAERLKLQFKKEWPGWHLRIYDSEKIAMEYVRTQEESELFHQGKISRKQFMDESWISSGAETQKHILLMMNRMWGKDTQLTWIAYGRDH